MPRIACTVRGASAWSIPMAGDSTPGMACGCQSGSSSRRSGLRGRTCLYEPNVEVRRVMQERMGERFVAELGGVVLDSGPRGTLYEVRLPEDDPERIARYVQVQDASTERHYMVRVPPTIQTASEAVAWTF